MGDKPLWVFELEKESDPFYREIRKILKECKLGPVFDITKERHPNGASSYIAKYLNKTTKSIKDPETERRVRHYDASIGWNLDRHPKPTRWAKQKYHRGVIADDRFDVNCDCDNHLDDPAWYMREWQKKVKEDSRLEKHLEYVLQTDKELPKTLQLENKGLLRELPLPVIKVAYKLYKEGKTWV